MSARTFMRARAFGAIVVLAALLALAGGAASASAASSWWLVNQSFAPTALKQGEEAAIVINAVNAGYAPIDATANAITFKDKLPAGVEVVSAATAIEGEAGEQVGKEPNHPTIVLACTNTENTISCPVKAKILPTESLRLKVLVKVTAPAGTTLTNEVTIEGGGVATTSAARSITTSATPVPFGVENYELRPENADGTLDTQAGSHPFQLSTTFNVNKTLFTAKSFGSGREEKRYSSPALTKNLNFILPPGLIGNVAHRPQCSGANFNTFLTGGLNLCEPDTAIGVGSVTVLIPGGQGDLTQPVPIFNLVPDPGEPARFGFEIHSVPVVLTTKVRTGSDYGVEVSVHYATEAANVLNSQVIFWGVPGDPRHDSERGWPCLGGGYFVEGLEVVPPCEPANETKPGSFLTMPTTCGGAPVSTVTGESWPTTGLKEEEPLHTDLLSGAYTFASPFTGCSLLPFQPTIEVTPDKTASSTPTGLNVKIKVPQSSTLSGTELAEAAIRDTTLQLPAGMTAAGGAANGLVSCAASGLGFNGLGETLGQQLENNKFSPDAASCPEAAKVGTVRINTPLLEGELHGSVYLAKVDTAPFTSPLVLYLTAEEATSGVKVKLAGEVSINEATGQLTSKFAGAPPLPFSELELHLFDGDRATQATPARCGTYGAGASFTASSSTESAPVVVNSEPGFAITSGPADEGGVCPTGATLPFGPGFKAGVGNTQGGAFTPFTVVLERNDGNQALKTLTVHEPPGAAAMLSSVTPCPTAVAEAAEPACPASSQIGESTAYAGVGGEPTAIPGQVYLTGPYHGAPFGLLAVTDATHVGPFDLGKIPVLSTITVDPSTAAATITSNPIPQFAPKPGDPAHSTGVPAQIKKLVVNVNRPGFTFNPTNCDPKSVTGETTGWEGGTSARPAPFQSSGCASLPFKPTISVNVESDFSRLNGTGMKIKVTSGKGQANIKKTKLVFPASVPSRLTTIQKACPSQTFNANPASCPEGSVIGTAIAHTPVLKSALTGPAYLVSHANESFPDAVFVLQGEGIKLILDGKTNIKGGVTSSTFETVPDAPVETFEVSLPRGPHSAFSGFGNLCEKPIEVPTTFGGQNGALIERPTKVTVEHCPKIGKKGATNESELAKLLKKCKKAKKHKARVKCEATARKQVKAVATCKKKNKGHTKKINSCVSKARKTYALKLK
ncbi:MAG: hypothetical protein QOK19_1240 [Solirubrobacteraceae bacterium]|nr:hypothetical protein [Solirubrobacteraceae bacterium]